MGYALITGASKGIGRSIAYELAARGYSLLLTARSEILLDEIAADIRTKYGVPVKTKALDLSLSNSPEQILQWAEESKADISILVNNAGYGLWGTFAYMPLEGQLNMLGLNVTSLVKLTHLFLPILLRQQKAYILNVASTSAYQSIATMAVYCASKAFVVNYTRAIRQEMKGTAVSISCLSPGATDTEFMDRAGINDRQIRKQAERVNMSSELVAKIAVSGMFRSEAEIIPGIPNKITALAAKFFPKAIIEKIAAGIYMKN